MNPLPVIKTEIVVFKAYLKGAISGFAWAGGYFGLLLLLGVGFIFVSPALGLVVINGSFSHTSSVPVAILTGVIWLILLTLYSGLHYRFTDKEFLGGGNFTSSLPIWRLIKGISFIVAIGLGGAVIGHVALEAIPWRLSNIGVSQGKTVVIVVLVIAYLPLFLRLTLLLPLIALDNYNVEPGWRLIIRTAHGKSLPLLGAILFQFLSAFLLSLLYLSAAGSSLKNWFDNIINHQTVSLSSSTTTSLIVLAALCALGLPLLFAYQAGVIRHFFGYAQQGIQEQHITVDDYERPAEAAQAAKPRSNVFDPNALQPTPTAVIRPSGPTEEAPLSYAPPVIRPQIKPQVTASPSETPVVSSEPAKLDKLAPVKGWDFLEPEPDDADPFEGLEAKGGVTNEGQEDPFATFSEEDNGKL